MLPSSDSLDRHSTDRVGLHLFWQQFGRHGMAYLIAEAFAKGGAYALFVWLATQMSVEEFGLLNVFVAWLSLTAVAIALGLPDSVLRFHFLEKDFRPALGVAVTVPIVAALCALLVVLAFGRSLFELAGTPFSLVLLAVATAPLIAMRQSWLALLRARRHTGLYVAARVLEPTAFLGVLIYIAATRPEVTYQYGAIAYLGGVGAIALVGLTGAVLRIGLGFSLATAGRMLRFSLPLVLHGFAMTGLAVFDQLAIQHLMGPTATGVYAYAYRFGMAMSIAVFALTAAWSPLVLERMGAASGEALRSVGVWGFRLLAAAGILFAWLLPYVAYLIGGDRYAGALHLIPVVVYAYLWMGLYGLAAGYIYFRQRSASLAVASAGAFVANALLNYLTIPYWGIEAAAATTLLSYMLLWIIAWRALGDDRGALPWGQLVIVALSLAPVFAAAVVVFSRLR